MALFVSHSSVGQRYFSSLIKWGIALIIVIGLPVFVWVASNKTPKAPKATTLISDIQISPGQIATALGGNQYEMSAQAVDGAGTPTDGVRYQWGMSSTNSVGNLIPNAGNDKLAIFLPSTVNAGTGDIWVRAYGTNNQVMTKSIPVYVGVTPPTSPPQATPSAYLKAECGPCGISAECAQGLVCQLVPTPTPNCPYGSSGPCSIPANTPYRACVKPDGSSVCPPQTSVPSWYPTPSPIPPTSSCPYDGASCSITSCPICYGFFCPKFACTVRQGVCQQGQCYPSGSVPTPTSAPAGSYCSGSDGSYCQLSLCPVCTGAYCPKYPCTIQPGTCQNHVCSAGPTPTCIPQPTCAPGTNCILPMYYPRGGWCPTPTPGQNVLTVLSPTNGEIVNTGQSYTITWQTRVPMSSYSLYLVNAYGQESLITGVNAPATSYVWNVGSPIKGPSQYKIKILGYYANAGAVGSVSAYSNGYFTIHPATCVRQAPTITLASTDNALSGHPGDPTQYHLVVTNNDSVGCGATTMTVSAQVPSGWGVDTQTTTAPAASAYSAIVTVHSPATIAGDGKGYPIRLFASNASASLTSYADASYTVLPNTQTLDFRVKLSGVTGDSAAGAHIAVKFALKDGSIVQLSSPLTLTYVANGIYDATAKLTNPFPPGTQFSIIIKGEKHANVKFTHQVGQTSQCADASWITVPNPIPETYGFDLTSVPLPAGDTQPQDGQVDQTDIDRIVALMGKPSASLTADDKLVGDLNYDGVVNVLDLFQLYKTLQIRCDVQ